MHLCLGVFVDSNENPVFEFVCFDWVYLILPVSVHYELFLTEGFWIYHEAMGIGTMDFKMFSLERKVHSLKKLEVFLCVYSF